MNLKKYTVCIVSYAKYMENKQMGKIINNYNKIIRINNGLNIVDEKYFGNRTDIFSSSFSSNKINMIVKTYNYLNKKNFKNIFEILNNMNIENILINHDNPELCNDVKKNCRNYKLNILFDPIKNLKLPLTSGLQAIIQILYLKPKELFICGFDFSMYFFRDYEKFYRMFKEKKADRLNKTYDELNIDHSTKFEKYILKKLWKKYRFNVDPFLKNILTSFQSLDKDQEILTQRNVNIKYIDAFNQITTLIDS